MYAIVLLSVKPELKTIEFFTKLKNQNYDLYICIDDNDYIIPNYNKDYINIIKFNDEEPKSHGYYGSVLYFPDRACSRDKALYYFCEINKKYDYVWHIEEDVFIPSINTIKNIDLKYLFGDLLVNAHTPYDKDPHWPHWGKITNKINKPWFCSLICSIRTSKKMLQVISDFVRLNKFLLFDECLYNTLAMHNNLNIINPLELKYITWRDKFTKPEEMNNNNLYHPIKSIELQYKYREIINNIDHFTNLFYFIK